MGLFYLLTLYSTVRAIAGAHSAAWTGAAIGACALGMMTKEPMATAPLMVLVYDSVFGAGSISGALRKRRALYVGLALSWVVLAALITPGPRWRSAGFASGVPMWTYLLNQPAMILTYLKLSVWPTSLVLDYGPTRPTSITAALPPAIVVLGVLAATIRVWLKAPQVAFVATWFLITLAPSSSIVPIATEVGAERRMYLPLAAVVIGFVLGVLWLHDRYWADARPRRRIAAVAVLSVALPLIWGSVRRNAEYSSPVGIWQTVLARRPHGRAHYNLGLELSRAGRRDEAVAHYRMAAVDEPKAHYALAVDHEQRDRLEEAEREYQIFLDRLPDDVQAPEGYVRLGIVLTRQDKLQDATRTLQRALEMRPQNVDAREAYGMALMGQGRLDEAAHEFERQIELAPASARGYEHLGLLRLGQARADAAIAPLERAVALAPDDPETRLALGNALVLSRRPQDALPHYREGIRRAPDAGALHAMLGSALGQLGQFAEARAEFERAVALGFKDPQLQQEYESLARRMPKR